MEDHDDQHLGPLLRLVGRRPVVQDEVRERVRVALHSQWKATVRARARKRGMWLGVGTAAAAMALYFGAAFVVNRDLLPPPVGFVENQVGAVLMMPFKGGESRRLARGEMVLENRCLESAGNGRLLLHLTGGASVRIDVDTRICANSVNSFHLERGTIYFDSEHSGRKLALTTPFGTVRNRGTQFEVRVNPDEIRIRVREGSVELEERGRKNTADAGMQLAVTGQGEVSRSEVSPFSPSYSWLSDVPPVFHLEGRTLGEFLGWLARENGWQVKFADPSIQHSASSIILHGSISGVRPEEMPDVVLPVCGLAYRLNDGVLTIEGIRPAEEQ